MGNTDAITITQQRLAAVEDLLKYCGNPAHVLSKGRLLGPALLGQMPTQVDDHALVIEIELWIERELTAFRQRHHLAAPAADSCEVVKAAMAAHDKELLQRSLLWAYYFQNVSTEQLARICACNDKTINNQTRAMREYLARYIARRERERGLSPDYGVHDGPFAEPPTTSFVVASPNKQSAPYDEAQPSAQQRGVRIYDSSTHTTVNQHYYGAAMQSAPPTQSSKRGKVREFLVVSSCAILALSLANPLLRVAPLPSVGMLLAIGTWRLAANSWHLWHTWQLWRHEREEVGWHSLRVVIWLALWGFTVATMLNERAPRQTWDQLLERFGWTFMFVALCMSLVFVGALDLLLWIDRTEQAQWPWLLLRQWGRNTTRERWPLLLIAALLPLVISLWLIAPYLSLLG